MDKSRNEGESFNTQDLISFAEKGEQQIKSKNHVPAAKPRHNVPIPMERKLCGYLLRINPSGIKKAPITHWYDFCKETCELFYYRTPTDDKYVGCIPIYNCSFTCNAEDIMQNTFTINTENRNFILQACDKETMQWWLQELQIERRIFVSSSNNLKLVSKQRSISGFNLPSYFKNNDLQYLTAHDQRTKSNTVSASASRESLSTPSIIPRMKTPPPTVGNQSAKPHSSSFTNTIGSGLQDIGNLLPGRLSLSRRYTKYSSTKERKGLDRPDIVLKLQSAAKMISLKGGKLLWSENNENEYKEIAETLSLAQEEIELLKLTLISKDETIELLKSVITKENKEKQEIKQNSPKPSQETSDENNEQISMLKEMLEAKDQIVMKLTNDLFEMENAFKESQRNLEEARLKSEETLIISCDKDGVSYDIDKMKDEIEAYKFQNKFLSNEILELAHLQNNLFNRLENDHDKFLEQEARRCQLESKYLILLADMNKPRQESFSSITLGGEVSIEKTKQQPEDADLVKQLIEDALADSTTTTSSKRPSHHDRHGFSMVPEDRDEASFLSASSSHLQRAANIMSDLSEHDASVYVKWDNYLTQNKELTRTVELKFLLRQGVPHELRPYVWKWLVSIRTHDIRLTVDKNYYERLLKHPPASLHSKQIELDLLRTLPNNKHFTEMSSDGITKLRKILHAFSIHNPGIGYCQGLNRIGAIALLYLNEEDAFWCLVAIVEVIMPPGYYSVTLTSSQADQRVLRDLMMDKLPRLHRHFESLNVDTSLITFNWFLCVFCDNVPSDTMFRIWDTFLNEGCKILFRFALAFFKLIEDDILEKTDYISVFNVLRRMSHQMYDSREISTKAFQGMNPFPKAKINRLRIKHLENVRKELAELDAIRNDFTTRNTGVSTTSSDMPSDEEDSG